MDVRYINPFIQAAQQVFNTMLGKSVEVGQPFLKTQPTPGGCLLSSIEVRGDLKGAIVLVVLRPTAAAIAAVLLGEELPGDSPDIADAIGEMTNLISGDARNRLTELSTHVSTPQQLTARQLDFQQQGKPTLCLPCASELGPFVIEATLAENHNRLARVPASPPPSAA